jgi:F-type H+-transporting ATPase subunit epsilon
MISDVFEFKLLTPHKLVLHTTVHSLSIPGKEGYFGVLKSHSDMLALIKPGLLKIKLDFNTSMRFIVSYGTCNVGNNTCKLMVDHTICIDEGFDLELIKQQIISLESEISTVGSTNRKIMLEQKFEFLNLCLKTNI